MEKLSSSQKSTSTLDTYYEECMGEFVNLKAYVSEIEMHCIKKVIESSNGNITQAAEKLGVHRSILYRKLKRQKNNTY